MLNLNKKEITNSGVHIGGIMKKKNPLMKKYTLEKKKNGKNFCFLNIKKTLASCLKLENYLNKLFSDNPDKQILILSTKKKSHELLIDLSLKNNIPYVIKWKGGLLTNFSTLRTKLKELYFLKKKKENDDFKELSKNKKNELEKRIVKLENLYGGLEGLKNLPIALFVIGRKTENAIKEAKKAKIPIISICGIKSNPYLVDYAIPGNNLNTNSVNFFLKYFFELVNKIRKIKEN